MNIWSSIHVLEGAAYTSTAIPRGTRLNLATIATAAFVAAAWLVGWRANSRALISDVGHTLTDAAALLLTLWTFTLAGKPADRTHTDGYRRAGVLAALANAVTLVILAGSIVYAGSQCFHHPAPVSSLPMIIVAIAAFVLTGAIVRGLHTAGHDDVNVTSALVHMAGDARVGGVLVAGIAVLLTGRTVWDPLVSLLIGLVLLWSSCGIGREASHNHAHRHDHCGGAPPLAIH